MWVVTTALNNAISPIVEYDVLLQGRCMFFPQKPQPALLHIKYSFLMNGMTATLRFHTKKHKTIHYTTIIPMLRDFPNRCSYVWWSNRSNIAKRKKKDYFFISTHQFIPGSVHLDTPLDGAVKLLVANELLLDSCRIISPGSCLNQTLEEQTRTETCVLLISPAHKHTQHVGAVKNKLKLRNKTRRNTADSKLF